MTRRPVVPRRKGDAEADAVIEYAKKVRDWPLLLEAVEQKMDELDDLVRWWKEIVRANHRPSGGRFLRRPIAKAVETSKPTVESNNSNGLDAGAQNAHSAEETTASARLRPIEGGCQVSVSVSLIRNGMTIAKSRSVIGLHCVAS